jgi:hypothetical protein
MLPTERISYSPITERPPLKLPGGARMVNRQRTNKDALSSEQRHRLDEIGFDCQ